MLDQNIEVVFTFDTTGSMYPCLTQVRRTLRENIGRLFREIPTIKIGVIAHGDYCDADSSYVTSHLDLTSNLDKLTTFVEKVSRTNGGDSPECYELVMHEARTRMSWTSGKSKVLAMIGDDIPHGPMERQNTKQIDWRNELGLLLESGINVYGVQALNRRHATPFWTEIAAKTGGFHFDLDQFSQVTDLIMAICYKQAGDEQLQAFEKEVVRDRRMTRSMDKVFSTLLKREVSRDFGATDLSAVPPGRFQILLVDKDCPIKQFAEENGLVFAAGRGFYEFTKSSTIQDYKEIILMDKTTGDLFSGARARELLGLPTSGSVTVRPERLDKYVPFVQSTSYNRKLLAGTRFLYEVSDWDR
jgi:hypothetical protein